MSQDNNIFDIDEIPSNKPEEGTSSYNGKKGVQKKGIFNKKNKKGTPPPPPEYCQKRKKKSFGQKVKLAIMAIIAFLVLFLICVNCIFRIPVSEYSKASQKAFKIPDIDKGFIPQGISYDETSGDFYLTGYMKDGSASPIYIVSRETKKLEKKVLMSAPNGTASTIHAGGITYYNGKVYVAGGESSCLFVYNPADIRNASNGDFVAYSSIIDLSKDGDNIRVSFTTVYDGLLYVGEFYKAPSYTTNDLHKVKTDSETHHALLVGLDINDNIATPVVAYSIPDKIQGMCFDNNYIYTSSSYGIAFSKLSLYNRSLIKSMGTINTLGTEVPLYILDKESLYDSFRLSPMSEEIDKVGNEIYVMNESASNKYIFGKLIGNKKVYKTDMDLLTGNKTENTPQ